MKCSEFYRYYLPSEQSKVYYDRIKAQLKGGVWTGEYDLPVRDRANATQDAFKAVCALRKDDPRFFFLNRSSTAAFRGNRLLLTNDPTYTRDQVTRIIRLLDMFLTRLTAGTSNLSLWERERVIYRRVVTCGVYENHAMETDHNVAGLLLRKAGVCEAFTDMLVLALRKAGLPCIRVSGQARSGGAHCWCVCWICGSAAHLDPTWEVKMRGEVGYRYFNLTDREIGIDHEVALPGNYRCEAPDLGFYARKGVLFQNASDARRYIRKELWRGARLIHLRLKHCGNMASVIHEALKWVFFGEYTYKTNSDLGTAIIKRTG